MSILETLARVNVSSLWRRRVQVWGFDLQAISLDRVLYLYLHRLRLMGRGERATLENHVRPGMRVIDVGANLGLYSLLLSRLVGEAGSVIAVEPDPELFEALQRNCRANRVENVRLCNAAAGSLSGHLSLFRSLVNAGDNRLVAGHPGALSRQVSVRAMTIDEIAAGEPIDFIKIDVQGWEGHVFRGMKQVVARNPGIRILFEFWPFGLREAGWEPEQLLAELEALGFSVGEIGPLPGGKSYVNLLAVRQGAVGAIQT